MLPASQDPVLPGSVQVESYRCTSDTAAVLLTIGEATIAAARAALYQQTLCVREIVTVANVSPFHHAFNMGSSAVTAPFFAQIDADMILDSDALARLREAMTADTGLVVGRLRDGMLGQVVGVKLFRSACVNQIGYPDSISPDTDFNAAMTMAGWRLHYAGQQPGGGWQTFGEHRPEYSPAYTFHKFQMEGARYRYRGNPGGLRWSLGQLNQSIHRYSMIALIALCAGVFREFDGDGLQPVEQISLAPFLTLQTFLRSRNYVPVGVADLEHLLSLPLREQFFAFYQLGNSLLQQEAAPTYLLIMDWLRKQPPHRVWMGQLAFARALFASDSDSDRDWTVLEPFLAAKKVPPPPFALLRSVLPGR